MPLVWSFLPYIAVSIAHVVLLALDSPLATPTKLLLMPLLALPVVVAVRRITPRLAAILVFGALLFSWLGDSAGALFPNAPEIPLMLGFFGIAHLTYIALFLRHSTRQRMPWWALIYVAWWIAMITVLGPHAGGLLVAVAIYGVVLAGTAAFATRCDPVVAAGGAFFLASDTILALRLFLPGSLPAWSSPVIMLTYTLGQGLIVAGILIALDRRRAS
ncbi:MAG: lysoplasmalogenase [Candidatus Microbacterium colombiense]|nr:MAG: lysoplasmalogenase [Microbacterium sp.]